MHHPHTEIPQSPDAIHRIVEDHAQRDPQAPAIADAYTIFAYGDLNARANRLARHLRAHGVQPEALVAICMQRTPSLFEGVLAVLKTGGAYVPLDPAYPVERLAEMMGQIHVRTFSGAEDMIEQALHASKTSLQIAIEGSRMDDDELSRRGL